jgi:hypothetical protein
MYIITPKNPYLEIFYLKLAPWLCSLEILGEKKKALAELIPLEDTLMELEVLVAALWNRNYFLRFRFLLLKSYGFGSDFWKSYGSGSGSYFWKVTVPVPASSISRP